MHFPTPLLAATATLLTLTAASPLDGAAAPRVNVAAVQKSGGFKDMVLSKIHTNTLEAANATADNREISFHLSDPNFNTTTTCSTTFHETTPSSNTTTRPTSYIPCAHNPGVKEGYRWFFDSYTGLGEFSLQLAHTFSDPANYPPPWDVVGLFATVEVALKCADGEGGEECKLGEGEKVKAPINGAIN